MTAEKSSTSATQTQRTLIVGIVVAVLLIAAVAYAAIRNPKQATQLPPAETSAPSASTPATRPVTVPSAITTSPVTGKPVAVKPTPGSTTPQGTLPSMPGAPKKPAAQGSKLTTLTAPPEKTIGMIVVPKGFKSGSYAIMFKPFGWGPSGPTGGRLVAQISTSKPLDAGAKSLGKDFAGRNATLWCSPQVTKLIKMGGSFSGTMEVRPQGDVGMLYLVKVEQK